MVFESPPATELITIPGVQILDKGGELNNPVVALERLGVESAPVILIFTGLSPGAHVASSEKDKSPGWWEFMVGAGKAIDTTFQEIDCPHGHDAFLIDEKNFCPVVTDYLESI